MLAQDADMFVVSTEHLMAQYVAKCEMPTIKHLQKVARKIMYVKSIFIILNRRALLLLKTAWHLSVSNVLAAQDCNHVVLESVSTMLHEVSR